MASALQTLAVVIGAGFVLCILVFGILLFLDYERGMRMLAGLAMFVKSLRKKPDRPHRHRRRDDPVERVHERREARPSMLMTIRQFATRGKEKP